MYKKNKNMKDSSTKSGFMIFLNNISRIFPEIKHFHLSVKLNPNHPSCRSVAVLGEGGLSSHPFIQSSTGRQ